MKKRIVAGVGDMLGCGYYRMAQPYSEVAKHGFDVLVTNCFNDVILDPHRDILVLQRQHAENVVQYAQEFHDKGGQIISEVDDYLHDLPANNPAKNAYPKNGPQLRNFEKIMGMSDLMTVSTQDLAIKYSKYVNNIKVCHNSLDIARFAEPQKEFHKNGIVRLGWAGSGTHYDDLLTVVKPITEIMRECPNTEFVFVGMDYKKLFPLDIQYRMKHAGHTFPIHKGKSLFVTPDGSNPVFQYYDLLTNANIDIAIAPILNHTFNKAKSYVKLLEYGITKIPFVASNYGPYAEFVNHRYGWYTKNTSVGFLADRNPEWKKYIKAMINDKELCEQVAQNNYQNVVHNHNIKDRVKEWLDALETIGAIPSQEQGSYEELIVKPN